ncbi:MAG: hydrogenase maturation nickel metallochaperone HypA, partial [Cyanobacteria bacterium J06607_13]
MAKRNQRRFLYHQRYPLQKSPLHLTVGEFTCVEPQSLQFAFAAQTQGTFLEGVALVI